MDEVRELAVVSRINELAKKAKTEGLTAEETAERDALRKEYIEAYRKNLRGTLENIRIVDEQGNQHQLKKRTLH